MTPVIKDIREVTDSKEMYESKPHPFLSIFIYIILVSMILAGIWMYFGEIDIVSKGRGVVRPNENVSMIRNKVQGEIASCDLEEGKNVKKGDILFTIAHDDLEIKRLQAEEVFKDTEKRLSLLKKFKSSIEQDINLFSQDTEIEYYQRYVKYKQDYMSLSNNVNIENKTDEIATTQTKFSKEGYQEKVNEYENSHEQLKQYKQSIEKGQNIFKDKQCTYALDFNNYLIKINQLERNIVDKQFTYNLNSELKENDLVAEKEYEASKEALELAENELIQLKTATLKSVQDEIKQIESNKKLAEQEMNKLIIDDGLIQTNVEQRELALKKYKTDALVEIYNQIEEQEVLYQSQKRELESTQLAIANCTIKSPIDGTIHITQEVSTGDLIASGTDIATIIPINDTMYKIEIFMPNSEIAGLKIGDQIKYKFDALPYKEYGQLEGTIGNISSDAKVSDAQGISGYIVEGSISNETVYSYKNEPAEIKIGMTCEAHVITERKKILFYLLEKINLMD